MSSAGEPAHRAGSGEMFDAIARRYDVLNRVLSLGLDGAWRRHAVRALGVDGPARVLDVATGTGDVALAVACAFDRAEIVALDPSRGMLERAAQKARAAAGGERIRFVRGDACALPFEDRTFDGVTIAFGIRNVADRARALREMARVTRRRGSVVVLEFSEPRDGTLATLARFHIHEVVPRVGAVLSGANAYRYLQTSIAAFPRSDAFVEEMRDAGLACVRAEPMTFGVVWLYVATPSLRGGE